MRHTPARGAALCSSRVRAGLAAAAVLAVVGPSPLPGVAEADTVPTTATEQWSSQTPAPGVEIRTGTLQHPGVTHSWTVTIQAPGATRWSSNDPDAPASWAEVSTRDWADSTAQKLTAAGLRPRVESVQWPAYTDSPHGLMGYRVRVGNFATQSQAQSTSSAVTAAGFHPTLSWTGYDSQEPADRENVHVAVIDPKTFTGTVEGHPRRQCHTPHDHLGGVRQAQVAGRHQRRFLRDRIGRRCAGHHVRHRRLQR
ncbi:SPOR domain-containing protein [Streptomyces sp. NPDC055144]